MGNAPKRGQLMGRGHEPYPTDPYSELPHLGDSFPSSMPPLPQGTADLRDKGRYPKITMAADGAIVVKFGDTLGHYALAIDRDITKIHNFGRLPKAQGKANAGKSHPNLMPIPDGRIFPGETIHHGPTYNNSRGVSPKAAFQQYLIPDDVRKRIIAETVAVDYSIPGENFPLLRKVVDRIDNTSDGFHLLALIAPYFTNERIVQAGEVLDDVGDVGGLLGAVLSPVTTYFDLKDAWDAPYRYIGMKAAAWAITAWAFDVPAQPPPKQDLMKIPKNADSHFANVWNGVSRDAFSKLDAFVHEKKIPKRTYQKLLRDVADSDPTKLAYQLFEEFSKKLNDAQKLAASKEWWTDYPSRH